MAGLAVLDKCYAQMKSEFDARFGGIGGAPKFPQPSNYAFLLRYAQHRKGQEVGPVGFQGGTGEVELVS